MKFIHLRTTLVVLFAALTVSACGGGSDSSDSTATSDDADTSSETASGPSIELGEFFITPDSETYEAGETTFTAENVGTAGHEVVVYRSDEEADALAVEDGVAKLDEADILGEVEVGAGATEELTVTLEPGSYILLCNLPGHYQSGQTTSITVT